MTCRSDNKPLCPYCGEHNGHPDGVEMIPIKSPRFLPDKTRILGTFYKCPYCGARSPWEHMQDVAFASALRRFQPMQKPLTLEEAIELEGGWIEGSTQAGELAVFCSVNDLHDYGISVSLPVP